MCKFIRIINGQEYEDYLRTKGLYKYIPRKILKVFQVYIKPRVVCAYMSKDNEKEVGLGVGLFLSEYNIDGDEYKQKIIDTINNLKEQEEYEDVQYLMADNLRLDINDIKQIEQQCNIKVPEGKDLFAENVPRCLDHISKIKNQEISEKEVFIISDGTKVTEQLVTALALSSRFISVYSNDSDFSERMERDVLNKTGLSLHVIETIDVCYDNFDFIINLNEDIDFNISRLARNKVIIDLSINKCLFNSSSKTAKKFILIDDIFLKNDQNIYSRDNIGDFDKLLNSSISTMLKNNNNVMEKIQVHGKMCSVEEGINIHKFNKQNTSCFEKIECS